VRTNFVLLLVSSISLLDFETRKDAAQVRRIAEYSKLQR
jgi:hypothetical protein